MFTSHSRTNYLNTENIPFKSSAIVEEAEQFLSTNHEAQQHLQQVADLMYGFETPYDLELLSTVGWILKETPEKAHDKDFIVELVKSWNERKRRIFPEGDIIKVQDYLVHEVNFV